MRNMLLEGGEMDSQTHKTYPWQVHPNERAEVAISVLAPRREEAGPLSHVLLSGNGQTLLLDREGFEGFLHVLLEQAEVLVKLYRPATVAHMGRVMQTTTVTVDGERGCSIPIWLVSPFWWSSTERLRLVMPLGRLLVYNVVAWGEKRLLSLPCDGSLEDYLRFQELWTEVTDRLLALGGVAEADKTNLVNLEEHRERKLRQRRR